VTHAIVVGAGIVGLSCAWAAQRRDVKVTLVDRDFEGDRTSHGNAGGIAVTECVPLSLAGLGLKPIKWLLDPLGPLSVRATHAPRMLLWFLALRRVAEPARYNAIARALAALNDRSLRDFESLMHAIGLGAELHRRGALTVYETSAAWRADAAEWTLKQSLGVRWRAVDAGEIRALEPGLAPVFQCGVVLEDWVHVSDPKRVVETLCEHVLSRGAERVQGSAVSLRKTSSGSVEVELDGGRSLAADKVVVAAGAWSARLAQTLGDRALLESERGYNTTLPRSAQRLTREVIFAERKFVATPLAIGLRIGGAAEFAGLEAPANYQRSEALLKLARRFLLDLDEQDAKQWMGHRPATPDSLPVIGPSSHTDAVLYAFGHGHLGLTQAATTGELIGDLLSGAKTPLDIAPYSISRF
jgi:D-amino-acid dehydrogenase